MSLKSKRSQIKYMAAISNTGPTFPGHLEFFFLKRTHSHGCEFPKSWAWQYGKHSKVLYSTFYIERSPTKAQRPSEGQVIPILGIWNIWIVSRK